MLIAQFAPSVPSPLVIRTSLIVTLLAVTLIVPCRSRFEIVSSGVPALIVPELGVSDVPAGTPEMDAYGWPQALGSDTRLCCVPGNDVGGGGEEGGGAGVEWYGGFPGGGGGGGGLRGVVWAWPAATGQPGASSLGGGPLGRRACPPTRTPPASTCAPPSAAPCARRYGSTRRGAGCAA